jgi:hypothetical protein
MKLLFCILLGIYLHGNTCMACHNDKMKQCKGSNHFTLKNEINLTRTIWGISDSNVTLQTLPQAKADIQNPSELVDDFLRRKCLKCHLTSSQVNPSKNLCLACHSPHINSQDAFKAKATQEKCLSCHNNNYIGTDYLGLFPHDYDKAYRSPISKKGFYPSRPYDIDYHHLNSDIHFQKGLQCIDCHQKTSNVSNWETTVSCSNCHKDLSQQNHKVYHQKISCNACHATWTINSYELNVLRDDTPNYKQWKRLTVQEDSYLEHFLNKAIKSKKSIKPVMPDYLDNKLKKGIWYSGWKFKRWENFFLVNDKNNQIKIAIPRYQYRISYKDENGTMIFNDINSMNGEKIEAFIPKSPHTIGKYAKSCEMCHENRIMLDQSLMNSDILKGKIYKGTPLSKEQLLKLTSSYYKIERAKILFNGNN